MSISEKIISWSSMNSDLLFLLGSLSIFILIISVFMMVLIISFLPEDYFKSENRNLISSVQNSRYPLLKLLVLITKNFFGFFFNKLVVKFPVPGPTSSIALFLTSSRFEITSITFLSIKKFCPKLFFCFINFYPKNLLLALN